jgi:hypothetical protein
VSATDQRLLHPIPQMTTYELAQLRQALKQVLALETLPPMCRPRDELQADLDAVIAEEADRANIRRTGRRYGSA